MQEWPTFAVGPFLLLLQAFFRFEDVAEGVDPPVFAANGDDLSPLHALVGSEAGPGGIL